MTTTLKVIDQATAAGVEQRILETWEALSCWAEGTLSRLLQARVRCVFVPTLDEATTPRRRAALVVVSDYSGRWYTLQLRVVDERNQGYHLLLHSKVESPGCWRVDSCDPDVDAFLPSWADVRRIVAESDEIVAAVATALDEAKHSADRALCDVSVLSA